MTNNLPATTNVAAVETFDDKLRYCQAMAAADILPRQYRDKPANLLFAIEYSDSLALPRMSAITGIHVIEGKPSASADLIAGLIRRAGHKLRIISDDTRAEAILIRVDDPDFEFRAVWDLEKAKTAGLLDKGGNWKKYPGAMLRARAITEVGRMGASDVLHGLIYTPEELGAVVDENGDPVGGANPRPQPVQHVEHRTQQPPQQRQAVTAPQQAKSGMEALAEHLGGAIEAQNPDEEALFDSFCEKVGEATTREELLRLHSLAGEKFTGANLVAAQKLCSDTAADLGVAKSKEEAQAEQHEQAVAAVQETLGAAAIEPDEVLPPAEA